MEQLADSSSSRHPIVVEGFVCPTDCRISVVGGFTPMLWVLGEGPDKVRFKRPPMMTKTSGFHFPSPVQGSLLSHSGARSGGGAGWQVHGDWAIGVGWCELGGGWVS